MREERERHLLVWMLLTCSTVIKTESTVAVRQTRTLFCNATCKRQVNLAVSVCSFLWYICFYEDFCEPGPIQASGAPYTSRRTSSFSLKASGTYAYSVRNILGSQKYIYITKAKWRIAKRERGPSPSITGFILAVGYKRCNIQVTNLDSPVHISSKKPWEQTALAYVCIHVCAVVFIHLHTCGDHRLMWLGSSFVTLHLVSRDRVSYWAWSSPIWLVGVTVSTSRHWSRSSHTRLFC